MVLVDSLLQQLLFVLEKLLTRHDVMQVNVRHVWTMIITVHIAADVTSVSNSHNLPLILLPILRLMTFKVLLLLILIIRVRIFLLNPVGRSL